MTTQQAAAGPNESHSTTTSQRQRFPRSEEQLRATVSMLAHFIWYGKTRDNDHMWSIPVDFQRDWDCILDDGITELVTLRAFARAVLDGYATDNVGDIDGGWLQDKALELGLLVEGGGDDPLYYLADSLRGLSPLVGEAPNDDAGRLEPERKAKDTSSVRQPEEETKEV